MVVCSGYGYSFGNRQLDLCPTWGDYQACYRTPGPNSTEQDIIQKEYDDYGGMTARALQIIIDASCRYCIALNISFIFDHLSNES